MRKTDRFVALAAVLTVGSLTALASAQIVVDGTRDAAAYGLPKAIQTIGTQFGNATNGNAIQANGGSELDNAYSTIANGNLYLHFGGNLESNYNKLEIFIDSIAGGQSTLRGDNSGIDFGGLNRMGGDGVNPGLKLPNGFAADYYVTVTNGNSDTGIQYFANAAELLDDGRGNGDFIGGSGVLDPNTATNAVIPASTAGFGQGIVIGANQSNTAGVNSLGNPNDSDPATVNTGIEVAIPLSLIGNPNGSIFVTAMVNGGGHDFLSNQFITGLAADTGNLGEPRTADLSTQGGYFTAGIATSTANRFNVASGNYSTPTNYLTNAVPINDGSQILTVDRSSPVAITLDQAVNLNYLEVGSGAVTVSGANTLTLTGSSRRAIRVLAGSLNISSPVVVTKDAAYEVAAGSSVTLSNFDNQGKYVDKVGGGLLAVPRVSGGGVVGTGIDVRGGTVKLTGSEVSNVNLLSIAAGSALDLTNGAIVVNYTLDGNGVGSPLAALKTAITNGAFTSTTITDPKTAMGYLDSAANPALVSYLGEPLTATSLVFRQTLKGDATLNKIVDFNDLVLLAQNYNGTLKEWYQGDFTGDGKVDFNDLVPLAQNYNGSLLSGDALTSLGGADFAADWALAQSLVPEPTSLAALALAGAMLKRRRA